MKFGDELKHQRMYVKYDKANQYALIGHRPLT